MLKYGQYSNIQGVPKKRGISDGCNDCFTDQVVCNQKHSLLTKLKIEIHMMLPSIQLIYEEYQGAKKNFLLISDLFVKTVYYAVVNYNED